MTCWDWQLKIAAEVEDPAIAEHLSGCEACREFAQDLAENAAALRSIDVDVAAYTAVRARVLEAVRPKRRFAWLWPAAATAACLLVLWWTALLLAPVSQPRVVAYRVPLPETTAPSRSRLGGERRGVGGERRGVGGERRGVGSDRRTSASGVRRPRHRRLVAQMTQKEPLTAIKLLTDDPNVVIIWLVDKKGD
jgi:hypothetical protein